MLRHELNGMIHVPCLKQQKAAHLFLGFCIGTVGHRDSAILPIQGQRGFRRLKTFSGAKMPVGAQIVVVLKALVKTLRVALPRSYREFCWVEVSQTDVFHAPFLLLAVSSATLRAGSFTL
jgi:hypothetical protein